MKFFYDKLILWMKNGNIRTLTFEPNKVNIITGGSETGKSSILSIIDYCFFADKNIKITQEFINENVEWYGIRFSINDKLYTIARGQLIGNIPSTSYYFSSLGKIPKHPTETISEKELKGQINKEFSINDNIIVPFGGTKIKEGSKISIKYFMLFNSQDEGTIDSSDVYFDKQTDIKYQEALERTFDLALGISSERDVIINEKINQLNLELNKYERKQKTIDNKKSAFESEKWELIRRAKEFGLIDNLITDEEEAIQAIQNAYDGKLETNNWGMSRELENLEYEEKKIKRNINIIRNFLSQQSQYTRLKKNNIDSLKPIKYLTENYNELITHPAVEDIICSLEDELFKISNDISLTDHNDFGLNAELKNLQDKLLKISDEKNKFIVNEPEQMNYMKKYMFLGEAKSKIQLFNSEVNIDYATKIEEIKNSLKELTNEVGNNEDKKKSILRLIELSAEKLLKKSKKAMETYADYIPIFNYKNKKLELMNPDIAQISKVVGSSSNYVFLHLCLILALHEVIIAQKVPYIPSYVILDQPSRPYFDNNNEQFKDREKITIAIQLLDGYITYINEKYNFDFQIIVFEHIPKDIWKGLNNINLVEEFINDNKLIRKCDINKS